MGIIDGDTIQVLNKGLLIDVHLADVDAPEEGQAYGLEARDFTWIMVHSMPVTVFVKEINQSGETVGKVVLMNTDAVLNKELIKAGFAWWDWKHSENMSYGDLEATAREFKVGLWKDEAPVPPWDFKIKSRNSLKK